MAERRRPQKPRRRPRDSARRAGLAAALAEPALEVDASALASDRRDPTLTPSERYMACLVAGAEEHGLPPEYVAFLRGVPARPETPEAAALRPLFEDVLGRRS